MRGFPRVSGPVVSYGAEEPRIGLAHLAGGVSGHAEYLPHWYGGPAGRRKVLLSLRVRPRRRHGSSGSTFSGARDDDVRRGGLFEWLACDGGRGAAAEQP